MLFPSSAYCISGSSSSFLLTAKGIDELDPSSKVKVSKFLNEVTELLPVKFKKYLNLKIVVEFTKTLASSPKLVTPNCRKNKVYPQRGNKKNKTNHSRHNLLGKFIKGRGILLNYYFLSKIIDSNKLKTDYACEHRNFYKLAMATLIHELSHAYDMKKSNEKTSKRKEKQSLCIEYKKKYYIYPSSVCKQRAREKDNILTDLVQYRHLSGWSDKGLLFPSSSLSHYEVKRSPLPYEYKSRSEHFPVNMEFFLLDKEYECRRPALYSFFSRYFDHRPFPTNDCKVNTKIELNNIIDRVLTKVDLRLKKVQSIHYLYAGPGEKISEMFGTGMFRIILCDRNDRSEKDCVKNSDNDIVFSYKRTGKELIVIDAQSMMDITYQYNDMLFRDLYSLPIKMDRFEKELFYYQLLSDYWEFSGKYYLGGGTVTTELIRPLKGALLNYDLYSKHPLSPKALFNDLIKSKVVDESIFQDVNGPESNGHIFYSSKSYYKRHYLRLKKSSDFLRTFESFEYYINNSKRSERRERLDEMDFDSRTEKYDNLFSFNQLEEFIYMKRYYLKNFSLQEQRRKLRQSEESNKFDYGIPLGELLRSIFLVR